MNERLAHDHAELGDLLGEVNAALDAKVIARSHASLDRFWARLAVHIRAEHLHLFPAILDALSGSRGNIPSADEALKAIEELRGDHDFFMHELSVAVATTRGLLTTTDPHVAEQQLEVVRTKLAAVEARLARHNRIEEEGIYLWTRSLSEAAKVALSESVDKELKKVPPRFGATSRG